MTGTEPLSEALNEVARMGQRIAELEGIITANSDAMAQGVDVMATGTELLTEIVEERTRLVEENARLHAENERLRDRVLDLEAKLAILCGSLARRAVMPEDEQPAVIHHDVEPNAPR